MRIHSSSLAAIPLQQRKTPTEEIARVNEEAIAKQLAPYKPNDTLTQHAVAKIASPAEIAQALDKDNSNKNNTLAQDERASKPFDQRTQHALNAYAAHANIQVQNQRTNLIGGVDLYA